MKILFLGDSVTDCGRNYGDPASMGQGYAFLVNAALSAKYPETYQFENLGVSGSRIVDLYARIKSDSWNRDPDVLSFLIGINDVWHELSFMNGVDAERFYRIYEMLIRDTQKALPGLRAMILMEPFILKASATEGAWDTFRKETELRALAVRELAEKTGQIFLPLQKMFDEAQNSAPASYWLVDGVHPTPAGHKLIADAWIKTFEEKIK